MIMTVKTPASQMGSPAAAEEGGEVMGGGRWESGDRSELRCLQKIQAYSRICTKK